MSNTIFCLVGQSGVGKTTIANALRDRYGYIVVNSYTTREPRFEGEEGHIFITEEEFDKLEDLCAYTFFNGHKYGVPAAMVDESDIYVIDPDGVKYLRQHYHNKRIYAIGLRASEETLRQRMAERGDSEVAIKKRIANDKVKFKDIGKVCDQFVFSTTFETTLEKVHAIIEGVEKEETGTAV